MIKWLCIVLFVVPRVIYSQIVLLVMNHNKRKYDVARRYKVVRTTVCWLNKFLRVDMNVINKEIITNSQEKGRIFVANHLNLYDVLALIVLSEKPLCFISKKENSKVPFLNTHLKAIETLCIDRESPRQSLKICKEAGLLVKEGKDIVIFAEGTRSKDGNVAPFRAALTTIIHYSESSTVLICLHNTQKPLSWKFITYPKERVNIKIFEELPYEFYLSNRKEFNEISRSLIQTQLNEFKNNNTK